MSAVPLKARVEPYREVMRRASMNLGRVSLPWHEEKLLVAARELSREDLLREEETYPCGGTFYVRFALTERVRLDDLRELWG